MVNATHSPTTMASASLQPTPTGAGTLSRLAALSVRAKLTLAMSTAALVALIMALAMWSKQGDWKVLYANLADKDAGAVVAQLSQMNVPHRYAEGGQAILVPSDKVHDVRLKLAQAGLPKGSVVGFELMDTARFGQTQFQERLSFQRGLEGELVRSIGSLAAVQSARVHLALPQQNGFFREQQKPRASVLLSLHAGRSLDRTQIAGIVHLVSSSVPEMSPKAVSVVDQTGTLLSGHGEGTNAHGMDGQQLQHVAQLEAAYMKRLIDILEPVVGRDNLRATVTADIDFSQSEATSEAFKPNQIKDSATVRSTQTSESSNGSANQPSGVPGAASNQPPVAAAAPLSGASAPLQAAAGGSSNGGTRRDSVTNYEVDKTVRVTRSASGIVKRLNAAVVVNHRSKTDAKGAVTTEPLAPDEIEKLNALAQEAVGYNKERGDSVKVINTLFRVEAANKVDPLPIWQQPWLFDMLRSVGVPAAFALVALALVFGVIKPALKTPPGAALVNGKLQVVADNALALPGVPTVADNRSTDQKLSDARMMAKQNPEAVAGVVRGWANGAAT